MKAILLGDIHGRTIWASRAADVALREETDTIIQVGDFGIWPGGQYARAFERLDKRLASLGVTMLVAPGNHEDYDQIDALVPRSDGWLEFRENILLAPRGHRTMLGGRSVLWLGGAGSVDRSMRVKSDRFANERHEHYGSSKRQRTWWPQEALTDADVEHAVAGGHAEIMVCHDAPQGVRAIDERIAGNPHGFSGADIAYAEESRARLTQVVKAVQPDLLVHGHFHFVVRDVFKVPFSEHETRIVGLGADGEPGSLLILDLEMMAAEAADRKVESQ